MVGSVILIDDFVCWNHVWVLFILSRCVHDPNIQSFVLNFVMCCILTWGIMWSVDVSISTSIFLQFPLHKCISSRKCAHSIVCREICNVSNSYKVLFWALNNDFEFQKWSILKNKINFQKKKQQKKFWEMTPKTTTIATYLWSALDCSIERVYIFMKSTTFCAFVNVLWLCMTKCEAINLNQMSQSICMNLLDFEKWDWKSVKEIELLSDCTFKPNQIKF